MTERESEIVELIANSSISSKEIFDRMESKLSYATLKRILIRLQEQNILETTGKGRGTKYQISVAFSLIKPIDINVYYQKEIDERAVIAQFNFSVINETLKQAKLFTQKEEENLNNLHKIYLKNISELTEREFQKELERLAIDLSWKSSQIEGNTYSLLETERLIKEKEAAAGKTREEATMLLNHKEAIDFIIENPDYLFPLEVRKIEDIHAILIKELQVERNLRRRRVGISGTNYKPLENEYQIKEALLMSCQLINEKESIFEKALLALVLISYIQPFMDGNKRTARIVSNSILINHNYCPLSFRTVDSLDYKKAMLVFYEQNNISSIKKIFIEQFEFAVKTYF